MNLLNIPDDLITFEDDDKTVYDFNITEDDLTEFFYYCKTEGNNSRRMKRRMPSISAFYNEAGIEAAKLAKYAEGYQTFEELYKYKGSN